VKRSSFCFGAMLCLVFAFVCQFALAQDCSTGQCFRSPSDRVASKIADVVVSAVEIPVRVVEHVVTESQPVRSLVACNGLAQWKAERQAAEGRMRHVGGGFGGGCAEGVGFSTSSPDRAIRACCYWGKLPVQEIGVARGRNGWYATVIYSQRATGPSRQQVTQYMQSNNGSAPPASWYPNGDPWRNLTAREVNEAFGD
jgi:hypothetical protein